MKKSYTVTLLFVLCTINGSTAAFLGLPEYHRSQLASYQQSPQLSTGHNQATWPMYRSVAHDLMSPEYPFSTMRAAAEPEVYAWIESRTGTGKCPGGFYCRAKMLVHREPAATRVSVGYMIYSLDGPKPVSPHSKAWIPATTESQAISFASVLIKAYNPGTICDLGTSQIAEAILAAGYKVILCETTGDVACNVMAEVIAC